ncbi:MAG: hypothetical protein LQ347_007124, partial [Umbilicaria vellea]
RGLFPFWSIMAATYEGVELTPWTPSYKALPKPPKEPKKRGRRTNAEKGLPPAAPKRTPDETRAENRIIFRKALTDWKLGGVPVLDSFEEVGENAYFCQLADRKRVIPSDAIRALIAQLPGQIWPFKDNKGLVWSRGGCNGPHGWILTRRDGLQYLLETQKLMQELIPADVWSGRPLPFTYGGIAKTFMRWTTIPAEPCWMHTENRLLHPGGIAHRRSVPGRHPGVV